MLYFVVDGVGTCLKFASNGEVVGINPVMALPLCVNGRRRLTISNWLIFGGLTIDQVTPMTKSFRVIHAEPIVIDGDVCDKVEPELKKYMFNPFSNIVVKKFVKCVKYRYIIFSLCCSEVEYYDTIYVVCKNCYVREKPMHDALLKVERLIEEKSKELAKYVTRCGFSYEFVAKDAYKLTEVTHKLASRLSRDLYTNVIVQIGLDGRIKVYVPFSLKDMVEDVVDIVDLIYDVERTDIFFVYDGYINSIFKFVQTHLVR